MSVRILQGDCRALLASMPDASVHCCVTSPPYFGLRDYGCEGQIGLEPTPAAYVEQMVAVFREVRRVLRDDGTLWLNLGDSYASGTKGSGGTGKSTLKNDGRSETARERGALAAQLRQSMDVRRLDCGLADKQLIGIPWRVAFALQADGWYLRQDIIWHKPNPMPESVTDRCTKAHEYVFLLSKGPRYFYDAEAIREPSMQPVGEPKRTGQGNANGNGKLKAGGAEGTNGTSTSILGSNQGSPFRNKRSVWNIATQPFAEAHFATMAPELAETCILAGCPEGGTVLDPFGGAGTTALVADRLQRNAVLCELNQEYIAIARRRILGDAPMFADVEVA